MDSPCCCPSLECPIHVSVLRFLCNQCGIAKPESAFYKNKNVKSGRKARCKECLKEKPEKRSFIQKDLTQEQETLANQKAIERLVKRHANEYHSLLIEEKSKIK